MRRGMIRTAAVAAAAVGVLTIVVAVGANGFPAERPRLLSGTAWLPSRAVGQLTLLDGSTAEVAAQVKVATAGDDLDAVQSGTTAYLVDRTTGSLRRVDGATFTASASVTPVPRASAGLQAFVADSGLYVLDNQRGVVASLDPTSLSVRGGLTPMAAAVDAQAATVDAHGRLWLVDNSTGDLSWIDRDGTRGARRRAVTPGAGRLALADGRPVLIDTRTGAAGAVDGDGRTTHLTHFDFREGDQTRIGGAPHADRLYLVASRSVLTVCELSATECGTAVTLGEPGSTFGQPVETAGRVFVPDYTTGRVWIVDLAGSRVVGDPQVLHPDTPFQLLTQDNVVFFNDPASEHAGVIRLDGGFTAVSKYHADTPTAGPSPRQSPDRPATGPTTGPTKGPTTGPTPPRSRPTTGPAPAPSHRTTSPPPAKLPVPAAPRTSSPAPRSPYTVQIVASKSAALTGEDVAFQVTATGGGAPVGAHWDLGDGTTTDAVQLTHRWTVAKTYQVTVHATGPGGEQALASIAVQVSQGPVVVPDLVGMTEDAARSALASVGLPAASTTLPSNTVAAGAVISQTPGAGTTAAPGTQVNLVVSAGKPTTVGLMDLAPDALWRSGAGTLPFNGADTDQRGFALIRDRTRVLEDGSAPVCLETHPQWVDNGYITGDFTLPEPVVAGDRFQATVGFMKLAGGISKGDAEFVVIGFAPNGAAVQLARVHDTAADGNLVPIDVDLSGVAGSTTVRLEVDAGATSAQDWAVWINPRVGG